MTVFRKISFYFALLGLCAATAVVIHLRATEPVMPPPVAPPVKPTTRGIAASGLVEARRENTNVGVPVPGLVTEVLVEVWDRVEKGQPVLKLDDRDLQATLLVQEANVGVAEATVRRVEDQCARLKKLVAGRAASAEDLEIRTNDVTITKAQLSAARAAVAQTHALLERLVIRAPITGTILQVNVRAGEYASPTSQKPPLVLGDIDEVQVRADVDEQLASRVVPGQKATGYIKGNATHPIELEFIRIEPYVIPKVSLTGSSIERVDTRVLQIIYAFDNTADHAVYVGQQMDVYLEAP